MTVDTVGQSGGKNEEDAFLYFSHPTQARIMSTTHIEDCEGAVAHPGILSGQHALLGLYPITSKGLSPLRDKVNLKETITIGRPREEIGVGQLFVWLAQDQAAMEALFPDDPETAHEWGSKVTLFKLEHVDSLGCQAILRLLPDGKIENIGGFSQLPGVMQSYVRIFFKNKEKKFEQCDAVGGAERQGEEDEIVNSVKALYECEDPEFTFALPMNDAFDADRLNLEQRARVLTPLEISRRLATAKGVKNSDFDEDWCRVDQPTIDAFLLLIGRDKDDVKPEDLLIPPPPPKKAKPAQSNTKASSTSRTTKEEPEESGEDEDDENGAPSVKVPSKRKKALVVEAESEDDSEGDVEGTSKDKGKNTEKNKKNKNVK
ncbi:hypothetical protein JCM5350_003832 [Sporobolomyces pararoseus]